MTDSTIHRRTLLRAAGASAAIAATGALSLGAACAWAASPEARGPEILDLGPAVRQFSLMSGVMIGDTVYIGSRNVEPPRIIAFHVPSGRVTARTDLAGGHSIQAIAADPSGKYVYAGVLQKDHGPNLFRWDVSNPQMPAVTLGKTGDPNLRAITVAPDGRVYAAGTTQGKDIPGPALWEYDPATGAIRSLGVPNPAANTPVGIRSVAATATTVFIGTGLMIDGTAATRAALFAYDRASGKFTNITPKEMLEGSSVRWVKLVGDRLVAGASGSSAIAAIRLDNLASYQIAKSTDDTAKAFARIGDRIIYAGGSGLRAYDFATNTIARVNTNGLELGEVWNIAERAGRAIVTSAYGFVAEIDLATGKSTVFDLVERGAQADPQAVMGIAASAGVVYVGGTGTIAKHDTRRGTVEYLRAPGEAKDAIIVDGDLITGQYSGEGIWRYDPRSGRPIAQAAKFPAAQNRPLDVCWDAAHQLALFAVQSDGAGGGAFWTYDPKGKQSRSFVNPIDRAQMVRAVATREGVAFLGGDNVLATGPRGTIVAFDPKAGKELWRLETNLGAGIGSLAIQGQHLYGIARNGTAFVVDVLLRTMVHKADIRKLAHGFSALVTNLGIVYGVSDTSVFKFDPTTFAATAVVEGINGGWYSGSHITNDEQGYLYTMRGRNLVRIKDHKR
ncbi:outer membrane protein assembly factor BamB family protein [Massilia cavernae]|uniref:Pyrrolo-quinoline quinone repeat domain-containing protein n=1 Tax=Massilia cavernae TaxID=2320864 RepID=A0A418Y865_9BURK|nr:PQQ-binding-like beta-propeller repeat protein [Massilia cavernae]RJG27485.1 hypothetical protein D3872_01145 [Massilia cavernae]